MIIKINGKEEEVKVPMNLAALVASRHLKPEAIVVEHNFQIVPHAAWKDIHLNENDTVEIVSFVGGG